MVSILSDIVSLFAINRFACTANQTLANYVQSNGIGHQVQFVYQDILLKSHINIVIICHVDLRSRRCANSVCENFESTDNRSHVVILLHCMRCQQDILPKCHLGVVYLLTVISLQSVNFYLCRTLGFFAQANLLSA